MDESAKPAGIEDGEALDAFVDEHDVALVEFYTKGCERCNAMVPVLGNVARVTDVSIALLNPGNDITLVHRFDIRSVPTLVLFKDGEEVGRLAEGFMQTEAVVAFLEDHVPEAAAA
ncbi:thioredoxin family protein [Natronococcus sp.]|uniref:thioredoxin family protein n=1 Tax=Natronococcus sp. TaxID=35747 RepID=UPI0025E4E4BE|nr:thioredoxin family protein [Natronococcus sp.]